MKFKILLYNISMKEMEKGRQLFSSLTYNKFKLDKFMETIDKLGPTKEYNWIMENCGGQNKNRIVICFFMI